MKANFYNQTDSDLTKEMKIIKKAFKQVKSKQSIQVIFVMEEEIKRLNNTYRSIDSVTDVLSFPSDEEKSHGDIFICVKRAYEQAKEYGHSSLREFAFLAVHGYLHLIGFDHQTKEEEKIMFKLQEEILRKAKIERV